MKSVSTLWEACDAVDGEVPCAVEGVERTFARIARHDPVLNCFTVLCRETALDAAAAVDSGISAGQSPGPLAGMPFAVKDLFDVEGLPTTAGSFLLGDAPAATADACIVGRLKQAGAILIGTLNMDEFAYGFATVNRHYGTTRNPHALDRLAGGSSGGSAAAVAAGLVPLALGSDTNGSVRVPAGLCGVFGLRPTHGVLPMEGVYPFVDRLDTAGPFARSVDVLRAAFRTMSGTPAAGTTPDVLRVGLLGGWFQTGGQADVLKAARIVSEALGGREEVTLALAKAGRSAAFLLTAAEGGRRHLGSLRQNPMAFDPATRDRLIAGALLPASVVAEAEAVAQASIDELLGALETFDVLVAPATPSVAPDIAAGTIEIDGKMVSARANLGLYTQPLSLAGVPVLSVPLNRPGQLPIGVQLVAGRGREEMLFDVAQRLVDGGIVAVDVPQPFAGTA